MLEPGVPHSVEAVVESKMLLSPCVLADPMDRPRGALIRTCSGQARVRGAPRGRHAPSSQAAEASEHGVKPPSTAERRSRVGHMDRAGCRTHSNEADRMMSLHRYRMLVTTGCLLAGLAAGCGTTGTCGPEVRDVTAATSQSTSLGSDYAEVGLAQSLGAPGVVSWLAQNTTVAPGDAVPYPLEQHVLAARLLDGAAEMAVILELPLQRIEGRDGVGGTLELDSASPSFDRIFQSVRTGQTVLELETDVPGQERMSRPLGTVLFRDWHQLACD